MGLRAKAYDRQVAEEQEFLLFQKLQLRLKFYLFGCRLTPPQGGKKGEKRVF